jgi:hypothetical protein
LIVCIFVEREIPSNKRKKRRGWLEPNLQDVNECSSGVYDGRGLDLEVRVGIWGILEQ